MGHDATEGSPLYRFVKIAASHLHILKTVQGAIKSREGRRALGDVRGDGRLAEATQNKSSHARARAEIESHAFPVSRQQSQELQGATEDCRKDEVRWRLEFTFIGQAMTVGGNDKARHGIEECASVELIVPKFARAEQAQ